jgi:hypothetical protein
MFSRWIVTNITSACGTVHCRKTHSLRGSTRDLWTVRVASLYRTQTPSVVLWDFKFSRQRVWCSELSSGIYCHVNLLSTDVSEVRRSKIILHGSISQKTILNTISGFVCCPSDICLIHNEKYDLFTTYFREQWAHYISKSKLTFSDYFLDSLNKKEDIEDPENVPWPFPQAWYRCSLLKAGVLKLFSWRTATYNLTHSVYHQSLF